MMFVPPPPDPQLSKLFGWLFILIAIPLACIPTTTVIDKLASRSWPRTQAQVLSSDMYERSGKGGHQWCVKLRYRYFVDKKEYASTRLTVTKLSSRACGRDKQVIEARLERFQPNARIGIRYDPNNPARAFVYLTDAEFIDYWLFAMTGWLFIGGIRVLKEADAMRARQEIHRGQTANA